MFDRRTIPRPVAAGAAAARSPRRMSPSRRRRPTAASSSSSSAAPPTGSARWRRPATRPSPRCAAPSPRISRAATRLDGLFTLHPTLAETARLYAAARRCSSTPSPRPIATARISTARTCSRPAAARAYALRDGWMNRLLGLLPRGERRGDRDLGDGADGAARRARGRLLRALGAARRLGRPARAGRQRSTTQRRRSSTPPGRRRCRPGPWPATSAARRPERRRDRRARGAASWPAPRARGSR